MATDLMDGYNAIFTSRVKQPMEIIHFNFGKKLIASTKFLAKKRTPFLRQAKKIDKTLYIKYS